MQTHARGAGVHKRLMPGHRDVRWRRMSAVESSEQRLLSTHRDNDWLPGTNSLSYAAAILLMNAWNRAPIAGLPLTHRQEVSLRSVSPYWVMHTPHHLGPGVIDVSDVMMTVFAAPGVRLRLGQC